MAVAKANINLPLPERSGAEVLNFYAPVKGSPLDLYFTAASTNVKNPITKAFSKATMSDAERYCGAIGNPRPSKAVPYKKTGPYKNKSSAESVLRSLGFYPVVVPVVSGSGWTRPQTWNPSVCNSGSFRDHAGLTGVAPTLFIAMQDYAGVTPRGEPNPELLNYIWPYLTWWSYVYWWHKNF